jgi:glycerol-3-phosphate acyltransferase PlsY
MSPQQLLIALIPVAYLLGSIPTGLLIARSRGIDLRKIGSGNIGATNVGRALGRKYFFIVMLIDAVKAAAPTLAASLVAGREPHTVGLHLLWLATPVAVVLGNVFSVFLKFKGGKGVATGAGIVLGVFPYFTYAGVAAIALFVLVYKAKGYISLASITAAASLPPLVVGFSLLLRLPIFGAGWPMLAVITLVAGLIIWRHRENIARLRAGTENKSGKAKPADDAAPAAPS